MEYRRDGNKDSPQTGKLHGFATLWRIWYFYSRRMYRFSTKCVHVRMFWWEFSWWTGMIAKFNWANRTELSKQHPCLTTPQLTQDLLFFPSHPQDPHMHLYKINFSCKPTASVLWTTTQLGNLSVKFICMCFIFNVLFRPRCQNLILAKIAFIFRIFSSHRRP